MKVSLILPSYLRPERTMRAIECIINQNFDDFEAYIVGDKCPVIQNLMDSGKAAEYINIAKNKNIKLSIFNLPIHYGGYGYQGRNTCIKLSYGKYIIFMDNDDVIEPDHVKTYYEAINDTDNDFMYFDTFIEPLQQVREAKAVQGMIGHSELIVKSSFLKAMQPEKDIYEHDWYLIEQMINADAKFEKGFIKPTYKIMGVGELREKNID